LIGRALINDLPPNRVLQRAVRFSLNLAFDNSNLERAANASGSIVGNLGVGDVFGTK